MNYGNDYQITKNFLGTQSILKENGKTILKAGLIVEYAPDADESVKEGNHIFVVSNEPGVYDIYHSEQQRYLLKHAYFTADNFCEESGVPMVYTKDQANFYISPDGVVHDLRLDLGDVYFSQDSRGLPTHKMVFRIVAGKPVTIYRDDMYSPVRNFGDNDYHTSNMLSRLPQGDHIDNPFVPFLITDQQDLGLFVGTEAPDEQVLRALANQYVRVTEGKFFNQAEYLKEVAKHFEAVATQHGKYTIESLRRELEANQDIIRRQEEALAPQRAEMEQLNKQINAINKALGQPEYDYDPDWEFFGKTAPYEQKPEDLASMPQEVQDAYAERDQLMARHQDLYFEVEEMPTDNAGIDSFHIARRISCIEYVSTIQDLANKIEQEQKVLSQPSQPQTTQMPTQPLEEQGTQDQSNGQPKNNPVE